MPLFKSAVRAQKLNTSDGERLEGQLCLPVYVVHVHVCIFPVPEDKKENKSTLPAYQPDIVLPSRDEGKLRVVLSLPSSP